MRKLILIALIALTACESVDKQALIKSFEPLESGFRFEVGFNAVYLENLAHHEAMRLRWLEEILAENNVCGDGYSITERKIFRRQTFVENATVGHFIYYGKCV